MPGRLTTRLVVLVVALAAGAAAWQWWNSPERRIARILTAVSEALSHDGPEAGLDSLTAVAALQPHLAPEVSIDTGGPNGPLVGRQEVISAAARIRAGTPAMHLQWFDPEIVLHDGAAATLRATLQVTTRSGSGEDVADAHRVEARLEERDGEWMVVTAAREAAEDGGR